MWRDGRAKGAKLLCTGHQCSAFHQIFGDLNDLLIFGDFEKGVLCLFVEGADGRAAAE